MADEQIGQVAPHLQVAQQIDDLRLHRAVERRGRLVEHDDFGIERQSAGDGDALALAAGKFVRIAVHGRRIEAGVGQSAARRLFTPRRRRQALVLDQQALLDDFRHRHARRQRAIGVLENDLQFLAQRPHLARGKAVDVLAEIEDRPFGADQAQQRQPERGLAGAGFADKRQRLALAQGERHAVHRFDIGRGAAKKALLDRKPDPQVLASPALRGRPDRRAARRPWVRPRAAFSCIRAGARRKSAAVAPVSTMRPCFITATSSAMRRTMPRSWVMNRIAMP